MHTYGNIHVTKASAEFRTQIAVCFFIWLCLLIWFLLVFVCFCLGGLIKKCGCDALLCLSLCCVVKYVPFFLLFPHELYCSMNMKPYRERIGRCFNNDEALWQH